MAAARLLAAVVDARTPLDGLTDAEHGHPQYRALDGRDRALVRAILMAALRHRNTIESLLAARLERPLPPGAATLSHILHVAAAQVLFLDVPDSAAVDLAVTHAHADPRTQRFAGLVNALLRGLARDKASALPQALATTVDAPPWLAAMLQGAYGDAAARKIIEAHRREPPTDFSVKGDAEGWARRLGGIVLPTGTVRLAQLPSAVAELPGYDEGAWWVQDAAAALPALLLEARPGMRVADLCAAPGGKTAQLALGGAAVTAVDASKNRIQRLRGNLERLGLAADIVQADMAEYRPAAPFDAVLLDAPCSSTGTLRRHPDVAWTKTPADVGKLAALQRRLLEAAIGLTRPGGRIVFSNCSLDPLEGEELVAGLLREVGAVELEPVRAGEFPALDAFLTAGGLLRTTPADLPHADPRLSGMDGFFSARLRRR